MKPKLPELTQLAPRHETRLTQTDLHRIDFYKQMKELCEQRLAEQQERASPDAESMAAEETVLRSIRKEIDRLEAKVKQL